MTEEDGEDSDPGGTFVFSVTCLEQVFGLRLVSHRQNRPNTMRIAKRASAFNGSINLEFPAALYLGMGIT